MERVANRKSSVGRSLALLLVTLFCPVATAQAQLAEDSAVSAATANTLMVRLSGIYVDVPAEAPNSIAGVDVKSGDYCVTDIYPSDTSAGQGVDPIGKFYFPMSGAVTLMAYDFNDGGQIALDVGKAPTWPFAWIRYPGNPPNYLGAAVGPPRSARPPPCRSSPPRAARRT